MLLHRISKPATRSPSSISSTKRPIIFGCRHISSTALYLILFSWRRWKIVSIVSTPSYSITSTRGSTLCLAENQSISWWTLREPTMLECSLYELKKTGSDLRHSQLGFEWYACLRAAVFWTRV